MDFIPESTDFDIPDVVEDIVGYRAWYVAKTGSFMRLASLNGYLWKPGRWNLARCPYHQEQHDAQGLRVPVESCSCGFYTARTREHLVSLGYNAYYDETIRVVGSVALKGKVIPGDQGWRAEKVRPVHLYLPHALWRYADKLGATYGVPVDLTNVFKGR